MRAGCIKGYRADPTNLSLYHVAIQTYGFAVHVELAYAGSIK